MPVTFTEVDGPEHLGSIGSLPAPVPSLAPLGAITSTAGKTIYKPSKLPSGFELIRSMLMDKTFVMLEYAVPGDSQRGPILAVRHVQAASLKVKHGFARATKIRDTDGVIVHGGWAMGTDDHPNPEWDANFITLVVFEQGEWTIVVSGTAPSDGSKYWTDEDLVAIAENLVEV